MIAALLGALLIGATLGLLGSGGSILTVPVLVYVLGHAKKVAIAESLAIVGAIALLAALRHARSGNIDWRAFLLFAAGGLVGAYLGAAGSGYVAGEVQLLVFAIVMVIAAVKMLRPTPPPSTEEGGETPAVGWPLLAGAGLGVGALSGFVGIGGGFMIVPALVLIGGLSMRQAVGTSLLAIAVNAAGGLLKHLDIVGRLEGGFDWGTVGLFIAVGFVGSLVGASVGQRLPQRTLRKAFAWFLVPMAALILWRELSALRGVG